MSIMTAKQLTSAIKSIKGNRTKLQEQIHEALISASFYAMKDGNATPFTQLLDAVGNATHLKGITMWSELNAPVIVRDGEFAINKSARKELHVTTEADFAPYEKDMRDGPKWYEIAGKQKVESVFDPMSYLGRVADKLDKEGFGDLALAVRASKGRFEMDMIAAVESVEV